MYVDKTAGERQKRYRNNVKLEDSTRGNSAIRPIRYKKDIPIQAWMESRYLATLSEWLDKDFYNRTRRLSEVVQEGIRILVDHLVNCGEVEMVDDPLAAQEMLEGKYGIKIRRGYGARGKDNFSHNLHLTEDRRKIAGSVDRGDRNYDVKNSPVRESTNPNIKFQMGQMTPEQREQHEKTMEEYDRRLKADMKAEAERQKANAMKSGKVVVVEHEGETTAERNERLARENSRRIEEDDMMPPGYDEE